jgi:hypothetical protein
MRKNEGAGKEIADKRYLTVLTTTFLLLLTSCVGTLTTQNYATYDKNSALFSKYNDVNKINIGLFSMSSDMITDTIQCRLNDQIKVPNGKSSYAEYIRKAFIAEFTRANLYSSSAPLSLSAKINNISLSTFGSATWVISLTIFSSNGRSVTIDETYTFKTTFDANTTCYNAAFYFVYAVQDLIGKALLDPNFILLMK